MPMTKLPVWTAPSGAKYALTHKSLFSLFCPDLTLCVSRDVQQAEMVRADVTPESPAEEQPIIGLIGMGAMGKMYAKFLSEGGWKRLDPQLGVIPALLTDRRIHVYDLPDKYETLRNDYAGKQEMLISLLSCSQCSRKTRRACDKGLS